jgi:putative endonuclease
MPYFVYILANSSGTLYTGVTNNLERRVLEHRTEPKGFTRKYRVGRLLYYEIADDARSAIAREKEIKGWRREKKLLLIESANLAWADLSDSRHRRR